MKTVVLAYSGGLDTSVILKWLQEEYQAQVIAYIADLGQGEELDGIEKKARAMGASQVYIEDLREEFITNYIFPSIQAQGTYESYLLGTALARPLIAKKQVEIAIREGAEAVAHGATGKGNDQVRFELAYKALAPHLHVIAPWREWNLHSRHALIQYAKQHNIPLSITPEKPYSCDRNVMHLSFEGGILEDIDQEAPQETYFLVRPIAETPNTPETLSIGFEQGIPTTLNHQKLSSIHLMNLLNEKAGLHGIGRIDIIENRLIGMKTRGVYESPGATLLLAAHKALESITLERDTAHYKQHVALKYAELVYNGLYFHPLRRALHAFIQETQRFVTGEITLKLHKGNILIQSRDSKHSLYNKQLCSFENADIYNHKDASGFIQLYSLNTLYAAQQK